MSRLLEDIARRLAGEQAVSRRGLILPSQRAGAIRYPSAQAGRTPAPPLTQPSAPATAADVDAIAVALEHAAPGRTDVLALVDAFRDPGSTSRAHARALAVARLRRNLRDARDVVARLRRSSLRDQTLSYLADVDTILVKLAEVAGTTDPARVSRLRAEAKPSSARVQALEKVLTPRVGKPVSKVGKP
jgi:hypothetical protein